MHEFYKAKLNVNLSFLVCCFLVFSNLALGNDIVIKPIAIAEDSEHFYAVLDEIAYIPNFYTSPSDAVKFATKTSKRVLKLPVSIVMDKFDFQKDEVISVTDLKNEKMYKYKIKDHIYVLYFNEPESSTFSNTSLILSDDPKVHERLAKEMIERPDMTGLAYRGSKRKMKPFNIEWIQVSDAPKNDPLYQSNILKVTRPSFLKKAKIYNYEVIIYPSTVSNNPYDKRSRFFFSKKDGTYEGFPRDSYHLDKNETNIKVYDIFEGVKVFKMFNDWGGTTSPVEYIILCGPNTLELLNLGSFNDNGRM